MQRRPGLRLRQLGALAVLLGVGLGGGTALGQAEGAPGPLPPALAAAWQKAGAEVGWMRPHPIGYLQFVPGPAGKARDVPAFRLSRWRAGMLAKLPVPAAPFGLYLVGTEVTDAGLKHLAELKQLRGLDLRETKVTAKGKADLKKALPKLKIIE